MYSYLFQRISKVLSVVCVYKKKLESVEKEKQCILFTRYIFILFQLLDIVNKCWLNETPPTSFDLVMQLMDPVTETEL